MPAISLVGNDGNFATGTGAITSFGFNVKVWAANISYVSTDVTGFAHAARARRLGLLDITGSLAGTPVVGQSATPFAGNTDITSKQLGGTIVLSNYNGTATQSAANLTFDAVFSSISMNTDKGGDATLTVNYELNDTNGPTIVWSTTL